MNTAREIGGAFGVAILVALTGPASSASDFRGAWVAIAALGLVSACAAIALGLTSLPPPAR